MPLRVAIDCIRTIRWTWRHGPFDLYIGAGVPNGATGVLLRLLRRVRRTVFYSIDFSPRRVESRPVNALFHLAEALTVRWSDETWDLSPEMAEGRRGLRWTGRLTHRTSEHTRVVPLGVQVRPPLPREESTEGRIVFIGHLLEKQGLQLVIEAMPKVLLHLPKAHLDIIGSGPHQAILEDLARAVGVTDAVTFHGYVASENDVHKILGSGDVGVATYLPSMASFTAYADPGKLKEYLASGLTIVMTSAAPTADRLAALGCAIVVDPLPDSIGLALREVLTDAAGREASAHAARAYIEQFDWKNVLTIALEPSVQAANRHRARR